MTPLRPAGAGPTFRRAQWLVTATLVFCALYALIAFPTHNNPPMIGLLIDAGADPEAKNNQGKTATQVAELNKHFAAAQAIKVLSASKAASAPAAPEAGQGTSSQ